MHSSVSQKAAVLTAPQEASYFTCPGFAAQDSDIVQEFLTCFREACEEIENSLPGLNEGFHPANLHRLFRALHSLKGNCQLMSLEPFVPALSALEDLAGELRANRRVYRSVMGEFMVLILEEVELLIKEVAATQEGDQHKLNWVTALAHRVCDPQKEEDRQSVYEAVLAELRGETVPVQADSPLVADSRHEPAVAPLPPDHVLMREWGLMADAVSLFRQGRTQLVQPMAELLNTYLPEPVPLTQLRAAIWMHDVGMAFIPHAIFNKESELSKEEWRRMQQHPWVGYQWLRRMGGWDDAALIVLHHHERFDGAGYPEQRQGAQIPMGARLLAVVDSYFAITHERADRNYKKGVLSAVTEINVNAGTQFDPLVVNLFNSMIRQHFLKRESAAAVMSSAEQAVTG